MYAIAEFMGKQIKIEENMLVEIPFTNGEVGDTIETDRVLLIQDNNGVKVGNPYIPSAKVSAVIYAHDKTKKSVGRIYKRRKQFKRTWGFRRDFTLIKITTVVA